MNLLIIAGEASADVYAAEILRNLKTINPDVKAFGVGGKHLQAAGMEITVPSSAISVMGFSDWLGRAREVIGGYRKMVRTVRNRIPDAALLLDLPDFNLRIAPTLQELDVPIVYFISPQVWAWRAHRIAAIRRLVTKMLVIFPFEEKLYATHGVDAEFVGHPLLEHVSARTLFRPSYEIQKEPRIAVLPGSRRSELRLHAQQVALLCRKLRASFPGAQVRTPVAPTVAGKPELNAYAAAGCELVDSPAESVLKWADIACVASGTATLETALVGTPGIIFYRVAKGTEIIFRIITPYRDFISLPNVILKKELVPEFVQQNFTAEKMFPVVRCLIEDESFRTEQQQGLAQLRSHLESTQLGSRPSEVVAKRVNGFLRQKNLLEGRRLLIEPTLA